MLFTQGWLLTEEAHRNTHPEQLRRLNTALAVTRLIRDEVAVVERLQPEVVEVEVGRWVERLCQAVKVVVQDVFRQTADFNHPLEG